MRKLFKYHYPKITILVLSFILAYYIFSNPIISNRIENLGNLGYLGILIAGMLFTFGFTTPFAIGFFLTAAPSNIYLAALIGGIGALISDLAIFHWIRFSFMEEFNRLEKNHPIKDLNKLIKKDLSLKVRNYILFVFAGFIIASPLPDEVGVTMLAGLSAIKTRTIAIISIISNTLGILAMLILSKTF